MTSYVWAIVFQEYNGQSSGPLVTEASHETTKIKKPRNHEIPKRITGTVWCFVFFAFSWLDSFALWWPVVVTPPVTRPTDRPSSLDAPGHRTPGSRRPGIATRRRRTSRGRAASLRTADPEDTRSSAARRPGR